MQLQNKRARPCSASCAVGTPSKHTTPPSDQWKRTLGTHNLALAAAPDARILSFGRGLCSPHSSQKKWLLARCNQHPNTRYQNPIVVPLRTYKFVYLMLVHHSWFATSSLHSCSISGYFLKMSATVV